MGPTPELSTYQQAAQSIYEPQLQSEISTAQTERNANVNSLNAEKGQVQTDYTAAIQNLQSSIQGQTAQINQLYTSRLLGNFSGLQGNDMGQMYSKANQQQGIIESTRANKLNSIATNIANEQMKETNLEGSLRSKYQGLESEYAYSNFGAAQKSYYDNIIRQQQMAETSRYHNAQLGLEYAKLNQSNANSSQAQYKVAGKYNVDTGKADSSKGYSFTGPNGTPVSLAEYVGGSGGDVNTVLDLLKNGSSYDKAIYSQVQAGKGTVGNNPQAILNLIAQEDSKNYYGFR
jgi:hypothetical protein